MIRNNLNIFYIAGITLFAGFVTGWFVKPDFFWINYEPTPDWYKPTDEERLTSTLKFNLSCDGDPAQDVNSAYMMTLLEKSKKSGLIDKNANGEYHINKLTLLGDVTDFGWKVTDKYSEFFYFSTKKYSVAAKLFKQAPDKSGVTKIVTEKRLSIDGWRVSKSIEIAKQARWVRIACRKYKQIGALN